MEITKTAFYKLMSAYRPMSYENYQCCSLGNAYITAPVLISVYEAILASLVMPLRRRNSLPIVQ